MWSFSVSVLRSTFSVFRVWRFSVLHVDIRGEGVFAFFVFGFCCVFVAVSCEQSLTIMSINQLSWVRPFCFIASSWVVVFCILSFCVLSVLYFRVLSLLFRVLGVCQVLRCVTRLPFGFALLAFAFCILDGFICFGSVLCFTRFKVCRFFLFEMRRFCVLRFAFLHVGALFCVWC